MNLSISLLLLTFLAGCSNNNPIQEETISQEATIESLQRDIENEINYYFYNESEKTKLIALKFKDEYSVEHIAKVELFYEGKMVSDNVDVFDTTIHDSGIFNIELQQYVPRFNEIQLTTQAGNKLYLKTGLYEFEKISVLNTLPKKEQLVLEKYTSLENTNLFEFQGTYEYKKNITEENIEVLTSKQSIDTLKLQTTMDFQKSDKINLKLETTMKTAKIASFELLIIQEDKNSGKTYLLNSIIVATD